MLKQILLATFVYGEGIDWIYSDKTRTEWKSCRQDSDCESTHVCVKHMFGDSENILDTGTGCAWKASCAGTATWEYQFDSSVEDYPWTQYFCSDE